MGRWDLCSRTGRRPTVAAFIGVALAVAACSSASDRLAGPSPNAAGTAATSASGTGGFAPSFTQTTGQTPAPDTQDVDCPRATIRDGASTYSIGTGSDTSALALRYQATFGQTARECALRGNIMTIKVGVQGRIILGPAGGPGQIDIPLRYAVVQEGPEPKTIWTKLYRFPVTILEGATNVPFTHVEQDMTFPFPANAADFDAYVIYVGFDALAKPEAPKKPAKKPAPPQRKR
jgi:hypothetical protein